MIKSIVSVAFATVLLGSVAYGQTSSTTTTTTDTKGGKVTESTTTTESVGTVTDFTPGTTIFLKTEADQPVRYKFGKNVTYVTADGKVIESSTIRKDSKVRVHYVKEGDDMLVDKVIVTETRN